MFSHYLGKFEVTDWTINAVLIHVRFNESLNSYKHDRQLLSQDRQTCSRSHHFLYSKCLPPAQTQARRCWHHIANRTFNEQRDSDCSFVLDALSQSVVRSCFVLEADISSMLCKDDATYYTFDDYWDKYCQSCLLLFNDSLKCKVLRWWLNLSPHVFQGNVST